MPVDMLTQPAREGPKVPRGKRPVQRSHRSLSSREQLGRVDVAQRIGREVPDHPLGPVAILQAAGAIVLRHHTQVPLVQLGPGAGEIRAAQIAAEQRALELEANDDVKVVGHLVGLRAQRARDHPIHGSTKRLHRNAPQRVGKSLEELRIDMPPESRAPSDEVLPQAGLRLVHAGRRRLPHGGAVVRGIERLVVERMPGLMQQREESAGEVARVVAQRHPDVAGADDGAKGMLPHIEPAALEVEAERRRDLPSDARLAFEEELAREIAQASGEEQAKADSKPALPARFTRKPTGWK